MRIADVSVAIAGAHDTCAFIAYRHTATEAMQDRDSQQSYYNSRR